MKPTLEGIHQLTEHFPYPLIPPSSRCCSPGAPGQNEADQPLPETAVWPVGHYVPRTHPSAPGGLSHSKAPPQPESYAGSPARNHPHPLPHPKPVHASSYNYRPLTRPPQKARAGPVKSEVIRMIWAG